MEKSGLFVKTFGCQMNEYDSEKVVRLLGDSHSPVESVDDAELVIVNTCSVREKGEHKLFSLLGSLREEKKDNPNLIVGVMGCVAQQEGEEIAKRNNAVDFVVGTHNLSMIPGLVRAVKDGRGRQVAVDYRDEWEELPLGFATESSPVLPTLSPGEGTRVSWIPQRTRALVSIQRGCDKNCSYCVVPFTRGPEVSRDPKEILREVSLKARLGAREVLLLGQTVNSYGRDLSPRYKFETLIRDIAAVPGVQRIRFTSPHPAEVKPGFLELYGDVPELCPHIHLPMQSGSDRILKLMNRNYRRARYLEIVRSVRERVPGIAVTTDVIVGFPTETDSDFQDTLSLMEEVGFSSSFSFKYSKRPNTAADTAFPAEDEVPTGIAEERLQILQTLQNRLTARFHETFLGKTVEVLVEDLRESRNSAEGGDLPAVATVWGRTGENISCEVSFETAEYPEWSKLEKGGARAGHLSLGDLVTVKVSETSWHGLRGRLCSAKAEVCGTGVSRLADERGT